jgi:hypothetical protein
LNTEVDASAVHRDLQKEQQQAIPSSTANGASAPKTLDDKLEKSLGAVPTKQGLSPAMKEHIYPDGRRVTQVKGAAGTYCVTEEGVGATDGIDQMQQGRRKKVTNCGHLFDK